MSLTFTILLFAQPCPICSDRTRFLTPFPHLRLQAAELLPQWAPIQVSLTPVVAAALLGL